MDDLADIPFLELAYALYAVPVLAGLHSLPLFLSQQGMIIHRVFFAGIFIYYLVAGKAFYYIPLFVN